MEWPAGAQHLQGATDIDCQVGSHPAGLGDHEYGFGQAAGISSLKGLELLQAHIEPTSQLGNAETLGLAALAEGLP